MSYNNILEENKSGQNIVISDGSATKLGGRSVKI